MSRKGPFSLFSISPPCHVLQKVRGNFLVAHISTKNSQTACPSEEASTASRESGREREIAKENRRKQLLPHKIHSYQRLEYNFIRMLIVVWTAMQSSAGDSQQRYDTIRKFREIAEDDDDEVKVWCCWNCSTIHIRWAFLGQVRVPTWVERQASRSVAFLGNGTKRLSCGLCLW